jgi:hypothetical protein
MARSRRHTLWISQDAIDAWTPPQTGKRGAQPVYSNIAIETAPTQRDDHLWAIESEGRFAWKRTSGYYAQAHGENAFSRFKRTFGDRLRAKRDESQEREAAIACELLNRMRELGLFQQQVIANARCQACHERTAL